MVVAADYQRQGRGTHGRTWHAPPGSCLMFTILVRPNMALDRLPGLPAQVAGSIGELLRDEFSLSPVMKPPNDILVDGKKICGVLCSSRVTGERLDWVLCGIGLNTVMQTHQLPLDLATSLVVAGVRDIPTHASLLESLLDRLEWLRRL